MKKYILFGAGNFGKMALDYYGKDNVECFVDNNAAKVGKCVHGKRIIGFREYLEIEKDFQTVISTNYVEAIAKQLEENGVHHYTSYAPFLEDFKTYITEVLAGKQLHYIAVYGVDRYTEQLIRALQELGLGSKLKYVAAPSDAEGSAQKLLPAYTVCSLEEIGADADCCIVSACKNNAALYMQLRQHTKRALILNPFRQRGYYSTNEIVFQQSSEDSVTEEQWNETVKNDLVKQSVRAYVDAAQRSPQLFEFVEIETLNRCNGVCSFCPVNKLIDPRVEAKMSWELFQNIIGQLEEMDYSGELTLFSNNEPLLDERIIELHQYAREHLPGARMHLFTNGTLFTIPKFAALIQYLDELVIDNYQQDLKLIKPCQEIKAYVEAHPELRKKVTIVLRKPDEVLTSRGGDAPNRKQMVSYGEETCALPFQQLIIRPDGKVSLCCNDPLGKCTLGDLTKESILDVWYGPRFQMVRKCLAEGRKNWKHCEYCDTFYVY